MEVEVKTLIAQKDHLEKEIAQLTEQIAILDQTKSFGKGLVDDEGYPR